MTVREPNSKVDSPSSLHRKNISSPDQIVARLAHLPEPRMRAIALSKILDSETAQHAAWILDTFATVGSSGGSSYQLALRAAVAIGEGRLLDPQKRRSIRQAAETSKLAACCELLSDTQHRSNNDKNELDNRDAPRPLAKGTRPLTLGERKSLARSWNRETLTLLWCDPSPKVLRLLLNNPRITEDDVLKFISAQPRDPDALQSIAEHARWSIQPRIQIALIRQQRCPESTALRLIALLSTTQRNTLLHDSSLPPRITSAIRRRLLPPC